MGESGVIGKLARGLTAGSGVISAWIGVNDAAVADALAREAFDAVTLDMQHGGVDFVGASRAILAVALAGKPTIVRIPVGDFACASRLVDAGAAAIIAPMIDGAEDARRFAEFMKFPPLGRRSWGPRAALALSGLIGPAYLHSANATTLAIAMIETREALSALDEILGAPRDRRRVRRAVRSFDRAQRRLDRRSRRRRGRGRVVADRRASPRARQVRRALLLRRRARQGGARARLRLVLGVDRPQPAARGRAPRTRRGALNEPSAADRPGFAANQRGSRQTRLPSLRAQTIIAALTGEEAACDGSNASPARATDAWEIQRCA